MDSVLIDCEKLNKLYKKDELSFSNGYASFEANSGDFVVTSEL